MPPNSPHCKRSTYASRFLDLVMLSLSPYGRSGPCANRAATEFTVQAESGSLSTRGRRDQPPVQAGGKIADYVGGTFAAVAALSAVMHAHITGQGEYIDFSLLEVFNIAGTSYADMMSSLWGRPEVPGMMRNVEVPSIEPTKDGWVGFATNSFQQYSDFLVMIGRPDLLEQKDLATAPGRSKRMQQWNEIVHAWTQQRTTAEIIEIAALLRIPVAPVNNGKTVLEHEQLVTREVFVQNPTAPRRREAFPATAPALSHKRRNTVCVSSCPGAGRASREYPHAPAQNRRAVVCGERSRITARRDSCARRHCLVGGASRDANARASRRGSIHLEAIQRPDGSRMMGGMYALYPKQPGTNTAPCSCRQTPTSSA